MKLRPQAKPAWPALRATLVDTLGPAFTVSGDDEPPEVTWTDGPAEGTVATTIGDVPGWRVESSLLGPDPQAPKAQSVLRFRRSLTVEALAVGVVRYRGARPRPFASTQDGAVANLWAILEEDDPATAAGYPLVQAMTAAFLDLLGDDRPTGTTVEIADALSERLEAAGYDALWSKAWVSADL